MSDLPLFPQVRGRGQVFPFPDAGRLVEENPPCLAWLPLDSKPRYTAVIYDEAGNEIWRGETEKNYIIPTPLPHAGNYSWNVFADGMQRGETRFTLSENAVPIRRVTAQELYDAIPDARPRHLFSASDIETLRETRTGEIAVLRRNIETAYADGLPERPRYHWDADALPMREYINVCRQYVDRNLAACAIGYALLGDEQAGAFAKKLFFTVLDWNPDGPCSQISSWGDEVGLSMSRTLPSVFDMLYPLLDEKERIYAARTVRIYGQQCWDRLKHLDFCANPGNSHCGRIPAYMGETALALKGTGVQSREEAIAWLDYALDIYGGIFPHYGTPDGGWAEGVFYATSYTRWYLPFFCAVERYSGCALLHRPFYQRLPQYFLHFASPDYENHPFGDGYWCSSEDPEWPGFFAQNPLRLYADRFGPELARQRTAASVDQPLYQLHVLDAFIPDGQKPPVSLTGEAKDLQAFPDAGFVAMHTDLRDPAHDLTVLARASRFGSDSHRHADQGNFAIFCGGSAMISPSGYFGRAYGTKHHFQWLKTSKAHNVLLVNGEGQATHSHLPTGKIVRCTEENSVKTAVLDLTNAYTGLLTQWIRTITLTERTVTVEDHVVAENAVTLTYPLHALSCPTLCGNDLHIVHGGHRLTVHPETGDLANCTVTDQFDVDLNEGEPEAYHVTRPTQYHAYYETPARPVHDLRVVFTWNE